jgi:hypothetical protein
VYLEREDQGSGDTLDAHDGKRTGEGADEGVDHDVSLLNRVLEGEEDQNGEHNES